MTNLLDERIDQYQSRDWGAVSFQALRFQRMVFTAKYMFTSQYRNATWSGLLESIT